PVAGELSLSFDERETLEVTLRVVTPLIGADRKLREIVDAAAALAGSSQRLPADALEAAALRVREAFAEAPRGVPQGHLQTTVERVLLEGRHHQRRSVLGQQRVRGLFHVRGAKAAMIAYLPESVAPELPLLSRLPARAVA